MDLTNIRMAKRGRCARLVLEPSDPSRILGQVWRQQFERHGPTEGEISGDPNFTHAAHPEGAQELVSVQAHAGCSAHQVFLRHIFARCSSRE
jgi:hypothetical protein